MNTKPEYCCYPDCFHCPYDDCHYDRLEHEDFKDNNIEEVDRNTQMARERANRYACKNREKIRKNSLDWYCAHHEERKEKNRQYAKENRARYAANKLKRYEENPDYYRDKQREYRERVKDCLPHCNECEECILVKKDKGDGFRRLCMKEMRLIEQKVSNSPQFCPKRMSRKERDHQRYLRRKEAGEFDKYRKKAVGDNTGVC